MERGGSTTLWFADLGLDGLGSADLLCHDFTQVLDFSVPRFPFLRRIAQCLAPGSTKNTVFLGLWARGALLRCDLFFPRVMVSHQPPRAKQGVHGVIKREPHSPVKDVASLLCASVSSSIKWDDNDSICAFIHSPCSECARSAALEYSNEQER